MNNGAEEFIEIGNGKRVARGSTVYRVGGGHNYPALERVRIKNLGVHEVFVEMADVQPGRYQLGMRARTRELFTTPEEAVAYRVDRIERDCAEAIKCTRALLK